MTLQRPKRKMSSHLYRALVLISSVKYGNSVPPDYCLHPLNKDNCNMPPRPVFYYYHPGSRCEIQTWRGCPTRNMFATELMCSSLCIMRMTYQSQDQINGEPAPLPFGVIVANGEDPCYELHNKGDCGAKAATKYYFSGGTCVKTEWRGCRSKNLFNDLLACIKACNPIMYFQPETKDAIQKLPVKEVKDIDKLIENAIHEEAEVTELPVLPEIPTSLPQDDVDNILLDLFNISDMSGAEANDEYFLADVNSSEYVGNYDPEKDEGEPEMLAADSEEGSLEEVFTLA